ncbi:MAG: hypothetical protein HC821_03675, partial [Lewinella sp.]|nr:hypothetical protein [Lewinella sp.]
MGVIGRQSIKNNLIQYVAVVIGLLGMLFVYKLDVDLYGRLSVLLEMGLLLATFTSLGSNPILIRFFPQFKESQASQARLFTFSLLLGGLGCCLAAGLLGLVGVPAVGLWLTERLPNAQLLLEYRWVVLSITVFTILYRVLNSQSANFMRITIQAITDSLLVKIGMIAVILGVVYQWWSPQAGAWGLAVVYGLIFLLAFVHLLLIGQFRLNFRL